mgnify:CR=1 FL=1
MKETKTDEVFIINIRNPSIYNNQDININPKLIFLS